MYHSLKMVRVWAEKEMRNLKRLKTAGICCPEPIEVRENVLVMTFVGDKDGWSVVPLRPSLPVLAANAYMDVQGFPTSKRRRHPRIRVPRSLRRAPAHDTEDVH